MGDKRQCTGKEKGREKGFWMSNGRKEYECCRWMSGSLEKDVSEDVSRSANCDMIVAFFQGQGQPVNVETKRRGQARALRAAFRQNHN